MTTGTVKLSDAQEALIGMMAGYGADMPFSDIPDILSEADSDLTLAEMREPLFRLLKTGYATHRMHAPGPEHRPEPEEQCYTLTEKGVTYGREVLGLEWLHHANSTEDGA